MLSVRVIKPAVRVKCSLPKFFVSKLIAFCSCNSIYCRTLHIVVKTGCFNFNSSHTLHSGFRLRRELSWESCDSLNIITSCSGVTRVGDTPGGNWGCHLSIFFMKKTGDLFWFFNHHRLCQFCGVTPYYLLLKNWRPLVTPLRSCSC